MAHFLVIDDDASLRQLMAMTLRRSGHDVIEAASGAEAIQCCAQALPDVVITDVIMPEDSLLDVIALRAQHPAIPFIVVSGLAPGSTRTEEAAHLLHASRTLPKPFRLGELIRVTDELLAELHLK